MSPSQRPLYFRLLRVRYLRPRSLTASVLFEGSVVLGVLLALADIVDWWGMLAVPIAVAAMVKVHDSVAGALRSPSAGGRSPRPDPDAAIGVASVPASYPGPTLAARLRPRPRPAIRRPPAPVPAREDVDGEPRGRPRPSTG